MYRNRGGRIRRIWNNVVFPLLGTAVFVASLGIVGHMDMDTEIAEGKIQVSEETVCEETVYMELPSAGLNLQIDIPYGLDIEDVYLIAQVTYLETGWQGEGYEYVTYLTACVIINRFLDWDYSSIEEVLADDGQYSTYGTDVEEINAMTWQQVSKALTDTDRNVHFQACNYWLDDDGYILYYDDGTTQIYE